jgi:hypothetical protein
MDRNKVIVFFSLQLHFEIGQEKLFLVIIQFRSTNLTHAQKIESHADFAGDVTRLFNNNLF